MHVFAAPITTEGQVLLLTHRIIANGTWLIRLQCHFWNELITTRNFFLSSLCLFLKDVFGCLPYAALSIDVESIEVMRDSAVAALEHFGDLSIGERLLPEKRVVSVNSVDLQ